jgi:hypothetical protein
VITLQYLGDIEGETMGSDRPNRHTLDILADPTIRDHAEDAVRALQDTARERQAVLGRPQQRAPKKER